MGKKREGNRSERQDGIREAAYRHIESFLEARNESSASLSVHEREFLKHHLSYVIGIPIQGMARIKALTPKYYLITPPLPFQVGTIRHVTKQSLFRDSLFSKKDHFMPELPQEKWNVVSRALLTICKDV